ncbi:Stk1 family PASTA domain-containing Ser/Thr kinase [Klugiella xanthotipulae]|uniref:non-specific serine/threonine protein kinase n=1 Tax=Klugiella xanthotipulae TaxID=244735 RepID=A0A543I702_9MICO|nr:Stk1 family PASTA domain-containing Ser/Thr kinase [Klugiella xanthotipulae]TQM66331.1 serine/threonine-protein kinase [Klugiella xanthotipulae]
MTDPQRILAGRYLVGDLIGQGGMSTVFRGTDTKLGRPVAVKILKASLANDSTFRERFRQEAQSASRMAHPTIVRVFDAGEELMQTADGTQLQLPFIVMEYVEGQNLKEILAPGPLAGEEACRIMESVLTALEYSHRAGVVHRDIKPANIMITSAGQIKVMDFGIARAISDTSSTVAQTTAILGTAAYFSPEQAKGETVDARTDLYSAGIVLYEMLTGKVPFTGDTAVAVAYQHVSEPATPPSDRNPEVSAPLDKIVMRAMAKDRAKRFQTAAEFREFVKVAASGKMPVFRTEENVEDSLFSSSGGSQLSESELALKQLADNTSVVRTQSRPPVMWIWGTILSIGVIVIAVIFWLLFTLVPANIVPETTRIIPDLVGQTQEEATDALNELDLVAQPLNEESSEVEAGTVIRTDPATGAKVSPETVINVYISVGPSSVVIPNFQNMTVEAASAALTKLGLTVGTIDQVDDATVPKGAVIDGTPTVGTSVPGGSTVDLKVSNGKVSVPDVVGQSMTVARDILSDLQLDVKLTPNNQCPTESGSPVVSQSIAGSQPQGSTVEIGYCSG